MIALTERQRSRLSPASRRLVELGFSFQDLRERAARWGDEWVMSFKRVHPDLWAIYLGKKEGE